MYFSHVHFLSRPLVKAGRLIQYWLQLPWLIANSIGVVQEGRGEGPWYASVHRSTPNGHQVKAVHDRKGVTLEVPVRDLQYLPHGGVNPYPPLGLLVQPGPHVRDTLGATAEFFKVKDPMPEPVKTFFPVQHAAVPVPLGPFGLLDG